MQVSRGKVMLGGLEGELLVNPYRARIAFDPLYSPRQQECVHTRLSVSLLELLAA